MWSFFTSLSTLFLFYSIIVVEYIQGETLDKAIDEHLKHMKRWAIHNIHGEVIFLEGHIKQVDIGHGIGHTMNAYKDVVITGVNNDKIKFE